MVAIYEQYTEEMHREFGYSATWLPNARLQLGDVGLFRKDRFDRVTSLNELNVDVERRQMGGASNLEYSSAGQVDVSFRPSAKVVAAAVGGDAMGTISVVFRRAHAILFQALGCRVWAISDLAKLESSLKHLLEQGTWRREYAVITEIVETDSAAILVSNQADARADFRISGFGSAGPFALAQMSHRMGVVTAAGVAVKLIAPEGLTPLFRVSAFKSRIGRSPQFAYRGTGESAPSPVVNPGDFAALSYAEAIDP